VRAEPPESSPEPSPEPQEIPIRGDTIRLGQLLKLAGVVDGGGEAKSLLATGTVHVNGEPETRRGRQLHPGDLVEADSARFRIS
jgi:ribosome-associated protein